MNLTKQSAEIINALRNNPELRLVARLRRYVASKSDQAMYSHGVSVVSIDRGRESVHAHYHGRVVLAMIEDGALELVRELPLNGKEYRLSKLARDLPQSAIDRAMEKNTRVTLANINAIAHKYGVKVERITARRMFCLEPLAGQKLPVRYMPYHPDDIGKEKPRPVTRIGDLTYTEWETLIIETIRSNKIPGVTDVD